MKKQIISILCLAIIVSPIFMQIDAVSSYSVDDWPMFRGNLNHTGASSTAPATTSDVLWQLDMGIPLGSSVAIVDSKIYVGTNAGSVYCIDAVDGTQEWKISLSQSYQAAISSSIAVDNSKLYFGCYNGAVYCLDAETGEQIWYYGTDDSIQSSPAVATDRVYIGSWDGKVYCFDADNGSKLWNYTTGALGRLIPRRC